jgi:organic radical activating enzyme
MYKLDYAEFYITNVCNLNCTNCNRFNNFNFTGHERWHEHVDDRAKWAELVDIKNIGILGGEPMLNPDFLKWVVGIAELWPRAGITIITNGTQLDRWPELYDILAKYKGRVLIGINEHNFFNREKTFNAIEKFLSGTVKKQPLFDKTHIAIWNNSYNNIKDPSWPDCPTPEDFVNLPEEIRQECETQFGVSLKIWQEEIYGMMFTDQNQVAVRFCPANSFYNTTVIHDVDTGKLSLNNSDPAKAVAICYSKKCHHFIRGKLYKCGPAGILPEFIKQFVVDITDKQRELINSYVPAEHSWPQINLDKFMQDLINEVPIDQCTFCPDQFINTKFNSTTKKIKMLKVGWQSGPMQAPAKR